MENKQDEILLVEDNPDDAELVMLAFKKNNIANKIKVVCDGAEALKYLFGSVDGEALQGVGPRLILLDLNLPKISGLEVLEKIKSHPKAKKIPVVVLTSSSNKRDMINSHYLGVNSYIHKPENFNQFIEATCWAVLAAIDRGTSYCYQ